MIFLGFGHHAGESTPTDHPRGCSVAPFFFLFFWVAATLNMVQAPKRVPFFPRVTEQLSPRVSSSRRASAVGGLAGLGVPGPHRRLPPERGSVDSSGGRRGGSRRRGELDIRFLRF